MDVLDTFNPQEPPGGLILVADDDKTSRHTLHLLLTREGYEVIEGKNGQEALDLARTRRPDAIVMDVMMPMIDGVGVCKAIRNDPELQLVPILLITAFEDPDCRLRGLRAGANDFIIKPVNGDELALKVHNVLHGSRMYEELRKSHEHVSRLEALKDNLMHMVVHDMRAPLMVVKGYLDLLGEDSEDLLNDEYAEYVGEAIAETATLVRMINTLYDIAALEAGTAELTVEKRDLVNVTEVALGSLGPMIGQAEVRWQKPLESLLIEMDAKLISRVMANLVAHALRYTPEDEVVKIEMAECESGVRVAISDMGGAIPEEHRETVFEKFGQARIWGNKKQYASGLGLAFSKLAIEAHGGMIGISSSTDGAEGNTVWFMLPVNSPHTQFMKDLADVGTEPKGAAHD